MTSNGLAKTEPGVFPVRDELARQLDQAFGTTFCYWTPGDDQWRSLDEGFAARESRAFADGAALVAAAAISQKSSVSVLADGECLLAVPLDRCDERHVVATAQFRNMSAELLRRQADLFLDAVSTRIENARLTTINASLTMQITENFEELAFLRSMSRHLVLEAHGVRLEDILRMILPRLCATLRAENLALVLPAARMAKLIGHDVLWANDDLLDKNRMFVLCDELRNRTLQAPVVEHSFWNRDVQATVIENSFQTSDFADHYPEVRGLIGVEVGEDANVGWLIAINRLAPPGGRQDDWLGSEQQFGTVEAALVTSAASMLATHFHNVELLHQKEELFTEIVRALVNAVEAKDPYTCGHSERVALFTQRLGQRIGLAKEACDRLHLSGLLHDVGKIAISDSALQKTGGLTIEEFAEISRHPEEGWAILSDLEHLRNILPGVLFHHERFDGDGYPDGLAGLEIPLEGRLMAICDAFDAMTSDRPYRSGMSVDKAVSILRSGAGPQWDPKLID